MGGLLGIDDGPRVDGNCPAAWSWWVSARVAMVSVLRMQPPLNALPRVTTAETEIGGVTIPAYSPVLAIQASANRDSAVFGADSEDFNPNRPGVNRHLTFGGGVHVCLGNMLARAELKSVVSALVKRIDNLKLVTPVAPLTDYHAVVMPFNYRLSKLEVEFTKRA